MAILAFDAHDLIADAAVGVSAHRLVRPPSRLVVREGLQHHLPQPALVEGRRQLGFDLELASTLGEKTSEHHMHTGRVLPWPAAGALPRPRWWDQLGELPGGLVLNDGLDALDETHCGSLAQLPLGTVLGVSPIKTDQVRRLIQRAHPSAFATASILPVSR